eukprot:419530-Hanusia_phi.AAC.1
MEAREERARDRSHCATVRSSRHKRSGSSRLFTYPNLNQERLFEGRANAWSILKKHSRVDLPPS